MPEPTSYDPPGADASAGRRGKDAANAAFQSYGELLEEVVRLREAGDSEAALALIVREGTRFPDQAAYVYLWRVSLLVALGRIDAALRAFGEALAAGCRYPEPMLREWPAARPLHDIVEFERLVHIASMRYDAELVASRPALVVERPAGPAPPAGHPLLFVLHGNHSTAKRTVPYWLAAAQAGWMLAVAQSAEIGLTPGTYVWNDRDRAHAQVLTQLAECAAKEPVDAARVVLAGYSAGALRALELALSAGATPIRAIVAIATYLPPREVDQLIANRTRSVPTYLVAGDRDHDARAGSIALAERLDAAGVRVRLEVRAGLGHVYPEDMERVVADALAFALEDA